MTDRIEQLDADLAQAEAQIAEAETALDQGGTVDLSPLGSVVDRACQCLSALPPATARPYADRLARLIDGLDRLMPALEKERGQVQDQLRDSGAHARAAVAYNRTPR